MVYLEPSAVTASRRPGITYPDPVGQHGPIRSPGHGEQLLGHPPLLVKPLAAREVHRGIRAVHQRGIAENLEEVERQRQSKGVVYRCG